MSTHVVRVIAEVKVEVADGSTAITRATENIEDFHYFFQPPITTAEQAVGYLAAAAVSTGVSDASRLDGWADLPRGEAQMWITDARADEVHL